MKRFEKKVAEVILMKKLAIRYGLISKKGKKGKEFSRLFPGCSVSISMHQNYSRHMKATAKLLKRSLRYHHSCKVSLSNASQTPGYHYMDCCPPLAPPPQNSIHVWEPNLLIRHFIFGHPTFLYCANTIVTAVMENEMGGRKPHSNAVTFLCQHVKFSISSSV